jgi:hypothetical protein
VKACGVLTVERVEEGSDEEGFDEIGSVVVISDKQNNH